MILMYHKIYPESPSIWWVYVNDFYRQMVEISNRDVVYLNDYDPKNENHVVITFDGVYSNVLKYALPILKKFNYPFELFITYDYLGKENEFDFVEPKTAFLAIEELNILIKGGGRLQWHTRAHLNLKDVKDINVIKKELSIPKEIKKLDPDGLNWFAYPHGEFNELVKEEVKKNFKGGVSCNQGNDYDSYCLNRITVLNSTSFRKSSIACIIASYNYGSYLIEAIESVIRQTILPNEILISDDASTDETQEIAEDYQKRFPDLIRYNRNKLNLGIVEHFNQAINMVSSEYVFFLGADNRILSNYVEETAKILDLNESTGIAYTDYAFFGLRAKLKFSEFPEEWKGKITDDIFYQIDFPTYAERVHLLQNLKRQNFIHGSSLFRKKAFLEIGGYKKTEKPEDYNLFLRMVDSGWNAKKAKNTNLEYRQHSVAQANDLLSIQNKFLFYRSRYYSVKKDYEKSLQKTNNFQKSYFFKMSFYLYRITQFLKLNYNKPDIILKRAKKINIKF